MATPVGEGHPESNEAFVETRRGGRVRHTSPDQGGSRSELLPVYFPEIQCPGEWDAAQLV